MLLEFRGKSLIEHVLDALSGSRVSEIVVVLGYEAEKVRDKLKGAAIKIVENPNYRGGLSTSIKAGLQALSPDADGIMICLADQPLLEAKDLNLLIDAFEAARKKRKNRKSIVMPLYRGRRGNPVILDARHRADILKITGDIGCRELIEKCRDEVLAVEMQNDHVVRDIDDAADYAELERLGAE